MSAKPLSMAGMALSDDIYLPYRYNAYGCLCTTTNLVLYDNYSTNHESRVFFSVRVTRVENKKVPFLHIALDE
jgi:hypothetical protein